MYRSYFTLIFGELVPKRIAMKKYETIAFASVGIIRFVAIVTLPFVRFLEISTNIVSKLFGVTGNEEETTTTGETLGSNNTSKSDSSTFSIVIFNIIFTLAACTIVIVYQNKKRIELENRILLLEGKKVVKDEK